MMVEIQKRRCLDSIITGNMRFYFSAPFLKDYRCIHEYVCTGRTYNQMTSCISHTLRTDVTNIIHRTIATATDPKIYASYHH